MGLIFMNDGEFIEQGAGDSMKGDHGYDGDAAVAAVDESIQALLDDQDIDEFFGCDPEFTGGKSTEEHLQEIRSGRQSSLTTDLLRLQNQNAELRGVLASEKQENAQLKRRIAALEAAQRAVDIDAGWSDFDS